MFRGAVGVRGFRKAAGIPRRLVPTVRYSPGHRRMRSFVASSVCVCHFVGADVLGDDMGCVLSSNFDRLWSISSPTACEAAGLVRVSRDDRVRTGGGRDGRLGSVCCGLIFFCFFCCGLMLSRFEDVP